MSPRRRDPKLKEKAAGLPTWVTAVGIGAMVVVAVVVLFTLQTPAAPAPPTAGGGSTSTNRIRGDPNAKIELIEYSDFQ